MFNLIKDIRTKLIPWTEHNASQRCIVARPQMHQSMMPGDVRLTSVEIPGKRVVVKNRRLDNTRFVTAIWPQAGLNEVQHHKLVCVFSGRANYQLGKFMVNCGPGNFFCIPPEFPHSDGSRNCAAPIKNGSCDLLYIIAHSNSLQLWIDRFVSGEKDGLENIHSEGNYLFSNGTLIRIFQLMMEVSFEQACAEEPHALSGLMQAFFAALWQDIVRERYILVNQTDTDYLRPLPTDPDNANFTTTLQHYIETHLHEHLTVEKAAHKLFMSRSQFSRRMRQETGKTFVEYVTEYRIEEAKRLLVDTEWTASIIAEMTGFKSAKYFYRVFRQHTGMPPIFFKNRQILKK